MSMQGSIGLGVRSFGDCLSGMQDDYGPFRRTERDKIECAGTWTFVLSCIVTRETFMTKSRGSESI